MAEFMSHAPTNAKFTLVLTLSSAKRRLDQVLLEELRKQNRNLQLRNITRTEFKDLFKRKKVQIKGQNATPSSSLAHGVTNIDILGFQDDST